jgi:murein DD-endopeptidase MepM/ murein hydrolase activator NlpD
MRRILVGLMVVAASLGAPVRAAVTDWIAPIDGPIVRHFEPPPTPYTAGHRGIDYAAPVGTDIVATAAGTISFAGQVGGQLFVTIDHGDGLKSTCSFLSQILVRTGQAVAQGQLIARSGEGHLDTADTELHFGIRLNDTYIDPEPLLVDSMRSNLWRVVSLAA